METTLGLLQPFNHGRGFPEVAAIANPAAGAGFTYVVGNAYWERLLSLSLTIVSDGNAANRQVTVTVKDQDAVPLATIAAGGVQAASLTRTYSFLPNVSQPGAVAGTAFVSPLFGFFLQPSWTLVVAIGAVQVGDQVSLIRLYRERFDTSRAGYPIGAEDQSATAARLERRGD